MARPKRAEQFSPLEVGVVHVCQRVVRRAYLAGLDALTGKDYGFRREWIRRRMELLSSVFGIDLLTYAIMSNHMHMILRTRPDIIEGWSDEEVAIRWLKVFPGERVEEYLSEPSYAAVEKILNTPGRVATLRLRLADVSWFMKVLSEPIARLANKQDECTGRFWEGRFKAQKIVDEAGLLACAMYVDLNPVRAAIASTPESSQFTSIFDRIRGLNGELQSAASREAIDASLDELVAADANCVDLQKRLDVMVAANNGRAAGRLRQQLQAAIEKLRSRKSDQLRRIRTDAWLAPLELNDRESAGAKPHKDGLRASDKGFLNMPLSDYLRLLDWTGRQGRPDKRGKIPDNLLPILERLGIESERWCDLVWNFKRYFGRSRAAGRPESLQAEAKRTNRGWIRGQRSASECFSAA
jgi:REP element-mobilizing transposase RayT